MLPGQRGRDLLGSSFARWYRTFSSGKFGAQSRNWRSRVPYLHSSFTSKLPRTESYTRFHESLDLVAALIKRGTAEDGERLLKILAFPKKRWKDSPILLEKLKLAISRFLSRKSTKVALQMIIFDRVRKNVRVVSAKGEPTAWEHEESDLVARLLPVLGAMHDRRFRLQFENFCRGGDPQLIFAAGRALMASGQARSIPVMAQAIARLTGAQRIEWFMHALFDLHDLLELGAREASGQRVAQFVRAKLVASAKPADKRALLPWLTIYRDKRTVPVLIHELDGEALDSGEGKEQDLWIREVHRALQTLTGFSAPAGAPLRWRKFWIDERKNFVLAPDPRLKREKGSTSAEGFFGIPVTGKRVVFILDTSGSMQSAMRARGTSARNVTRFARAKQELLAAIYGLDRDVRFTVLLFSSGLNLWRQELTSASMLNKLALKNYLKTFRPGGGTNLLPAMKRVLLLGEGAKENSADELFVLSDGMPAEKPSKILYQVSVLNEERGARINTVYLAGQRAELSLKLRKKFGKRREKAEKAASAFMKDLARRNSGVFQEVK